MTTLIRPVHISHYHLGMPMQTLGDKELFVFDPDKWVYEYLPGFTWQEYIVGVPDCCEGESFYLSDNNDDNTPF